MQFGRQDLAEADDGVLGRAVRPHAGICEQARARRRVDDMAGGLLRQHARQKRMKSVHDAHDIDIEKTSPVFDLAIDDPAGVRDARIVDQDVDMASIGKKRVGQPLHCVGVGHVDLMTDALSAFPGDGLRIVIVQVDAMNDCAFACQPQARWRGQFLNRRLSPRRSCR